MPSFFVQPKGGHFQPRRVPAGPAPKPDDRGLPRPRPPVPRATPAREPSREARAHRSRLHHVDIETISNGYRYPLLEKREESEEVQAALARLVDLEQQLCSGCFERAGFPEPLRCTFDEVLGCEDSNHSAGAKDIRQEPTEDGHQNEEPRAEADRRHHPSGRNRRSDHTNPAQNGQSNPAEILDRAK